MRHKNISLLLLLLCLTDLGAANALDRYVITITNLMPNQEIAPIIAASHKPKVNLFREGSEASPELETLAEEGAVGPLALQLRNDTAVNSVGTYNAHLQPGKSAKITIDAGQGFNRISLAAMIVPTNDGFIALNNVAAPKANQLMTYYSPAYDAGSEFNDESCLTIPGGYPECNRPGAGSNPIIGKQEGFVHIHAGIHGVGDFLQAQRDWKNPAAKITIRRLSN